MAKKKQKPAPETEALIWVDPDRVRFQHARIRPYFSGCGRSVQDTLEDLRQGKVLLADIPPIQVSRVDCCCCITKRFAFLP